MKKVLVVEDDVNLALLLRHFFERQDCIVTVMHNGANALRWLEEVILPDLVFLDIMLPDVNGLEICRKIKDLTLGKEIPVIIITGISDPKIEEKALKEFKADLYVKKPFDLKNLYSKTVEVLSRY